MYMREFLEAFVSVVIHNFELELVNGASEVHQKFHRRFAATAAIFNFHNSSAELRVVPIKG